MKFEKLLLDQIRKSTQHMNNNILIFHCDWQRIKNNITERLRKYYKERCIYFDNSIFEREWKIQKDNLIRERLGEFVAGRFTNEYQPKEHYKW